MGDGAVENVSEPALGMKIKKGEEKGGELVDGSLGSRLRDVRTMGASGGSREGQDQEKSIQADVSRIW